jgi:hypothetical protein
MDLFNRLGDLLVFVYHRLDLGVIRGYLGSLARPEQVVHFFRPFVGVAAVDKVVAVDQEVSALPPAERLSAAGGLRLVLSMILEVRSQSASSCSLLISDF